MSKVPKSVMNKLLKQSKNYQKAEAKGGASFEDLPDGNYAAVIKAMDIKDSNNIAVVYRMEVLEGDLKGTTFSKWDNLETLENWEYAKGTLAAMDIEPPDDIEGFVAIIENEETIGLHVAVKAKSREYEGKTHTSYYINELLEGGASADDAWTAADIEDATQEELFDAISDGELEGVSLKKAKKLKLKKLQKLLIAELPDPEEDEEDEEDDEDSDDDDSDDDDDDDGEAEDDTEEDEEESGLPEELAALGKRDLGAAMKKLGMSMAGTKGMPMEEFQAQCVEFLNEVDENADDDDDDDDDEGDDPDFEEMTVKELRAFYKADDRFDKATEKKLRKIKDKDDLVEAIDDFIEDLDD